MWTYRFIPSSLEREAIFHHLETIEQINWEKFVRENSTLDKMLPRASQLEVKSNHQLTHQETIKIDVASRGRNGHEGVLTRGQLASFVQVKLQVRAKVSEVLVS